MKSIPDMTVRALSGALQSRGISAREATLSYLQRVEARDGQIGAYLTVTREAALRQADAVDRLRAAGEPLDPLAGVPMAIKDNLSTRGIKTTCASKMLEDYKPPYDATAVDRLYEARCVLLGKLNMDEFAMGATTEHSYFHITKNPVDPSRVPGGSSGGSAAAVADHQAAFTLGSDTGGSIRQPAAFCGVVGMKPTYGRVSRYGLVAFASSLDQIGPITRDVLDNALILRQLSGRDPRDMTSVDPPERDLEQDLDRGVTGLRLALPEELMGPVIAPEVREAVRAAARALERQGARVEQVKMPSLRAALPAYYVISSSEASSNLSRFDGIRFGHRAAGAKSLEALYCRTRSEGFGPEVKRRILIGAFALSEENYEAYYHLALRARTLIVQDYARVFAEYDALISPVAPTAAYPLHQAEKDPVASYAGDLCTVPASLAGLPALSLPYGADRDGLPLAVQLTGPAFSEALLYRIGRALEVTRGGDTA